MIAALLLACVVGLNQWRADRLLAQCDGTAPDTAFYVLERLGVQPSYYACSLCCEESCASLCPGTCVTYLYGPWLEVDRVDEPGTGADVCFDWDTSPAGNFQGSEIPALGEVWWLNTYARDGAGNRSSACSPSGPPP